MFYANELYFIQAETRKRIIIYNSGVFYGKFRRLTATVNIVLPTY